MTGESCKKISQRYEIKEVSNLGVVMLAAIRDYIKFLDRRNGKKYGTNLLKPSKPVGYCHIWLLLLNEELYISSIEYFGKKKKIWNFLPEYD